MILLGELLALCASFVWTGSSLSAEVSSKRIGPMSLNLITMFFAFVFLTITLICFTGNPLPQYLNLRALLWIIGSGILCYVVCNFFLFSAYASIGSRLGQLFMTLSAPSAALMGWFLLDEKLTVQEIIGIAVTSGGIILSVLSNKSKSKPSDKISDKIEIKLTLKGAIFALIAAIAQGIGLVLGKVGMMEYEFNIPHHLTKIDNAIPLSSSFIRICVGLIGFIFIALISRQFGTLKSAIHNKIGFRAASLTALCGPFLGSTLALFAMRYAKAGIAATLMELTPILIILPAYYLFKQKVHFIEILGAIISVCGVALFFIKM